MERLIGTVEWFGTKNESYGYIAWEDGKRIFIHYKNVEEQNQRDPNHRDLKPEDVVSFKVGPGYHMEGTQALEVRIERLAITDDYRDERDR